jgi:hypothetical protein
MRALPPGLLMDTSSDFRTDSRGRDPDQYSPTLRRYHKLLWSKPLPDGRRFDLNDTTPRAYLHHRSNAGEFWLASDSVMATYTRWIRAQPLVAKFPPDQLAWFNTITYTIGGMMLFPGDKREGSMTINGARGCKPKIDDRMDLTLECIRRHYIGLDSPLAATLARYSDFFVLFGNLQGYVEFFLLQDLMNADQSSVAFFAPFSDFNTRGMPRDVETYAEFMRRSIGFVEARNSRIAAWMQAHASAVEE